MFAHNEGHQRTRFSFRHGYVAAHTLVANFNDNSWIHLDYEAGNRAGVPYTASVKRNLMLELLRCPFVYKSGQCPEGYDEETPPSLMRGKTPVEVIVMLPDGRTVAIFFRGFDRNVSGSTRGYWTASTSTSPEAWNSGLHASAAGISGLFPRPRCSILTRTSPLWRCPSASDQSGPSSLSSWRRTL